MNCIPVTYNQLEGVIKMSTLKSLVSRGRVIKIRRACYNTPALYDLNSFPFKYQVELYRRYPDLNADSQTKPFIDSIEVDAKAVAFYEDYLIDKHTHLSYTKIDEYAHNAYVLNVISEELIINKKPQGIFWKDIANIIKNIKCSLPKNHRRLRDKYQEYKEYGYIALISKRFNNQNARKK